MQHDHILKKPIFNQVKGQGKGHSDQKMVCNISRGIHTTNLGFLLQVT